VGSGPDFREDSVVSREVELAGPDVLESTVHGPVPTPVSPTEGTERPDGVAFDLPAGTETPGMPRGDQRPTNEDNAENITETASVPPGQLNPTGTND
jgi:hypothetical protein